MSNFNLMESHCGFHYFFTPKHLDNKGGDSYDQK